MTPAALIPDSPLAAPAVPPARPVPALVDAWPDARPFALTGWTERSGFTPGWTAVLAIVAAFIVFQTVANLGVAASVLPEILRQRLADGASAPPTVDDIGAAILGHPHAVLLWNSLGQALGFGAFTWLLAKLSTPQAAAFLRADRIDGTGLGLAALGWAALYPVVLVAGQLNRLIPLPDVFSQADAAREQMLEGFLLGGQLSTAFLFVTVALVPAIFEELLFRGYLLRQVERRATPARAFAIVGLAFGAYHLSAAQLLPLSMLGAYLCFVVWATGSVWTGTLVHVLNNGLAVIVSGALRGQPDLDPATVGEVGGPWYVSAALAAVGAAGVYLVGKALLARRIEQTGGRPDAAPLLPAPIASPP